MTKNEKDSADTTDQKDPDYQPSSQNPPLPHKRSANSSDQDCLLSPKGESALSQFRQGFIAVPMFNGTKRPAVAWQGEWREKQSEQAIQNHWEQYPDHDVAVIAGDDVLIADADTSEACARLEEIEAALKLAPNRVVKTRRGEHHYFRLAPGVSVKSFGGDSARNPEVIDIRTSSALALVPPSTDKVYQIDEAAAIEDLVAVNQAFVDAINRNNGRLPPLKSTIKTPPTAPEGHEPDEVHLRGILSSLDADMGYTDWIQVGMALHHEFSGSIIGLDLFDEWSKSGDKYKGRQRIERAWSGFKVDHEHPVTLGTLMHLAGRTHLEAEDADIFRREEEYLMPIENNESVQPGSPLRQFSLHGQRLTMAKEQRERYSVLNGIAEGGQWTVMYAPPNMGKTLISIHLLECAIAEDKIDPDNTFYINADDNFDGIVEKLEIAERLGFHMLAPGHRGLKERELPLLLRTMVDEGSALGAIVIIDTLKKFVDLMDKKACAEFGNVARLFVANGGTLITLAHVNKNRDSSGKVVYAGVSDIRDDADCAFTLDVVAEENDIRTVQFRNSKNRGGVRTQVSFQYSISESQTYNELVRSVEEVDPDAASALTPAHKEEDTLVDTIQTMIKEGHIVRTHLVQAVQNVAGVSRRKVEAALDKHAGKDPECHHWSVKDGERNSKVYSLLTIEE